MPIPFCRNPLSKQKTIAVIKSANSGEKTATSVTCYNPLSANPTKWSNTSNSLAKADKRIVLVCSTILWVWHLNCLNLLLLFWQKAQS